MRQDLREFILVRLHRYPYLVEQQYVKPPLRPHVVEKALECELIRVPQGVNLPIIWGFETELQRDRFISNFGGKKIAADQI